jgi:excisionase family DNA binding protein
MVTDLVPRWREQVEQLRQWGATGHAATLEHAADELQSWLRERDLEELTVREVAHRTGLSEAAIRKRVRVGRLRNVAPPGRQIRIRAVDALPGRRARSLTHPAEHPDVAALVLHRQATGR